MGQASVRWGGVRRPSARGADAGGVMREPTVLKNDVGPGIWSRLARADNRMWQSLREAIHTYAHNTGDPTRASGKYFDVAVTTHGRPSPRACGRDGCWRRP